MSRYLAAVFAAFLAFALASPAFAQTATTGLVRGTVTVDGKPVAGATVTLQGEGIKRTATTTSNGAYAFPQVQFGTYRITAEAPRAHSDAVIATVSGGSVQTINVALSTTLKQIASTTAIAHGGSGLSSNPPSVNQLTRTDISTSPVQYSLNRLLETMPGVVQFSYNEPVINGFHGVTYFVDGAPLPLATTSNFAEIIDPRNIDSIELLTGAIPAEYGGDRMGGVVNIITNRPTDVPQGFYGVVTGGFGNQAQGNGTLNLSARTGSTEIFLNANTQSTNRGLDAPTFDAIHDNQSQSDELLRVITQLSPRSSVAFNYSNQLSQFQIPINTDPNNPYDPIVSTPGTDDVQNEYDRFASLNFTQTSRDGNGVFQVIPWWRSTRVNYDGDLAQDVLGYTLPFQADAIMGNPPGAAPSFSAGADASALPYGATPNVGLLSNTYASYVGLRVSDFRATEDHAWKIGVDVNRSNLLASQAFGCYFPDCGATGVHAQPYYLLSSPEQSQAGSQIGIYGEDKWTLSKYAQLNYGLRYDASTGYVSGNQISPRVGLTLWDGGKNTVHMFYGKFYAAPLLEDVRQDCVVLEGCSGTPVYDLKPESDSYYEFGAVHAFNPTFTGSFNIFRRSVVNILDTTQLLDTPLFAVFNNAIGIDNGLELRLQQRMRNDDDWFFTSTISGSYAACVSGSTFLFPPDTNPPNQSCVSQLSPEDHDETVVSTAGYTWRFGRGHQWFTTLQGNYGSGFPVQFENSNTVLAGRLPAHTTFDLAAGRNLYTGLGPQDRGLGIQLLVNNILNHQYLIKVANGFNTTQIANGTTVQLRLSAPF